MSQIDFKVRASSACPACGQRHVVDLDVVLAAQPIGSHSLAGVQTKASAREEWRYTCTRCGATGRSAPLAFGLEQLRALEAEGCGHIALTGHSPGIGHDTSVCPGCCQACRDDSGKT